MDLKKLLKKLAFTDYALSSNRKVVSGFGLGVGASLLVLTVLFLNHPFKASLLVPMFQGFNGISGNSSLVSWSFSFSSTVSSSSSSELQNPMDLLPRNGEERVREKTNVGNFSDRSKNATFIGSNGGELVTEKTHEGNLSKQDKNASFFDSGGGVIVTDKTYEGNFPEKGKNGSFFGEIGRVAEKTHQGNLSGEFNNATFSGKEAAIPQKTREGNIVGRDRNETFLGKSGGYTERVPDKNNVGNVNVSDNERNMRSPGREERDSEKTHEGNLHEKDKFSNSPSDSESVKRHGDYSGKCDIFDGRWVRDEKKPYYPAGSCPHIDRDFDCYLNGRPDYEFLKWRWQPNGCDIPSLNATDFLERLRGKRLVFVGDSLNRNMWESLVCILRHSVTNKNKVHEISGKTEFKKKGFYAFRYEDYNCSIDFVSAPFLVRESSFKGRNGSVETLRLDLMDRSTSMYHEADVIVFNTGHWWTHEKTSRGENYYQEGNYVYPKLKVMQAYKKAMTTWARWVDKNIDVNRTQVFFRGYSVTHFRGGQWNSGGQCHKESEPIFNASYLAKYPSKMRALEPVLKQMRTHVAYLNISRLTDYRKDGHPSIYRREYKTVEEQIAAERSQDCSHWCLPGVPDTWNELLYASLLKAGRGSWRN